MSPTEPAEYSFIPTADRADQHKREAERRSAQPRWAQARPTRASDATAR
jgi:hypothetical protein